KISKQTDQYRDLVRNMLNTSPACSFLVQTFRSGDYKARKWPQINTDNTDYSFRVIRVYLWRILYGLGGVAPCGVIQSSLLSWSFFGPSIVLIRLLSIPRELTR